MDEPIDLGLDPELPADSSFTALSGNGFELVDDVGIVDNTLNDQNM